MVQDELLIVDESQLLIPPTPVEPPPRPASPALPPGVLSVLQLQQLAAALQQTAAGGFLPLADAVEVMLKMASQGEGCQAASCQGPPRRRSSLMPIVYLPPVLTGCWQCSQ